VRVLVFNTSNGNVFITEHGQLLIKDRLLTVSKFFSMDVMAQVFSSYEAGKRFIRERDNRTTLTITDTYVEVAARDLYWRGVIKASKLITIEPGEGPF